MVRNRKKKIAIIYEEEKTEENIFKNISQHFFCRAGRYYDYDVACGRKFVYVVDKAAGG